MIKATKGLFMMQKIFNHPTFLLLLFVFLVIAGISYFFPSSLKPSPQATVVQQLKCKTDKISPRLAEIAVGSGAPLKLVVSFRQQPSEQQITQLAKLGITLYPDTWMFDYLVAETDFRQLCQLAAQEGVTYIDAWQS